MDWMDSFSDWLIANPDLIGNAISSIFATIFYPILWLIRNPYTMKLAPIWMCITITIGTAGRYTIRLIRAGRAGRFFGVVWNGFMLAIVPAISVWLTLALTSNRMRSPIAWEYLGLAFLLHIVMLIPAYFYANKWEDDLEDVLWWPSVPAVILLLLAYSPQIFVVLVLFFAAMYFVAKSRSHSDSMIVRDYLINRSRDYRLRR